MIVCVKLKIQIENKMYILKTVFLIVSISVFMVKSSISEPSDNDQINWLENYCNTTLSSSCVCIITKNNETADKEFTCSTFNNAHIKTDRYILSKGSEKVKIECDSTSKIDIDSKLLEHVTKIEQSIKKETQKLIIQRCPIHIGSQDIDNQLLDIELLECDLSDTTQNNNNIQNLFDHIEFSSLKLEANQLTKLPLPNTKLHLLEKLSIVKNSLTAISKQTFSKFPSIEFLSLKQNRIHLLNDDCLYTLNKLKKIDFSFNYLNELSPNLLSKNIKLENINLSFNEIKKIEENTFANLQHLINLDLSNNNLTALPTKLFEKNTMLENIYFANNKIKTLPDSFLSNLPLLYILDLSNNKLNALQADLFNRNLKLEKIHLGSNHIKSIPEFLIAHLPRLNSINLSNNSLTTLPSNLFIKNEVLELIDLSSNPITISFSHIFNSNLKTLNLSNMTLKTISNKTFDGLSQLKMLNLSNNNLTSLNFLIPEKLQKLYLDHNNFEKINYTILDNPCSENGSLTTLTLSNNPWNCDCGVEDFAQFLRNYSQSNKINLIEDASSIVCASNNATHITTLFNANVCTTSLATIIVIVFCIILALLVLIFVVVAVKKNLISFKKKSKTVLPTTIEVS